MLIHDAARPLCSPELVAALVQAAAEHGGAVPGLLADDLAAFGADGTIVPLAGRHVRVQTPQVFAARPLLEAYERAAGTGFDGTDTAACVERFSSLPVGFVRARRRTSRSPIRPIWGWPTSSSAAGAPRRRRAALTGARDACNSRPMTRPDHEETIFTWGAPPLKFGAGAADEIGFEMAGSASGGC